MNICILDYKCSNNTTEGGIENNLCKQYTELEKILCCLIGITLSIIFVFAMKYYLKKKNDEADEAEIMHQANIQNNQPLNNENIQKDNNNTNQHDNKNINNDEIQIIEIENEIPKQDIGDNINTSNKF
jgi:predicted membrane protein